MAYRYLLQHETNERRTRRAKNAYKRSRMVRKAHNLQREPRRIGSGGENRACALRLKRVDSAASVRHFLLSSRPFEISRNRSCRNQQQMKIRTIFLWTILRFSYSFEERESDFMDEWKIHRMLIYNIGKCIRRSEMERESFQTWINLISRSRFLYINFLRSFRPSKDIPHERINNILIRIRSKLSLR